MAMKKLGALSSVILVNLDLARSNGDERLQELRQLAESAGLSVSAIVRGKGIKPDPKTYVGSGKASDIAALVSQTGASVVIFNHELTPAQQRNLSILLNCQIIDRTSLILDIFAQRAQSYEGKLQVELAQLEYLSTRLIRGWTHLERQKGGIGLRGPGETQLETDRRLIKKRVKFLKEKLLTLQRQRGMQRKARVKTKMLSVSIVGYTNAGKSTLFNKLTRAETYIADQLFATLDTTTRKLFLADGNTVVISDTVGFIRDLPHTLVAAFRATLEETTQADLLLHVIDANNPNREEQIEEVNKILREIGADTIPQILVLNKIDLVQSALGCKSCVRDVYDRISRIHLSARTGEGMDYLRQALLEASMENSKKWHVGSANSTRTIRDRASAQ